MKMFKNNHAMAFEFNIHGNMHEIFGKNKVFNSCLPAIANLILPL